MNRNKVLAAIDVGSSKVTTLIGQINESSEKINIIGASAIPSLGIRKGQIVNIEEATDSIIRSVEAAERMAGLALSKVWVTVGGGHISSLNSHGVVAVAEPQGEIDEEDIRRVIEAARAISLPSSREIIHALPRTFIVDSQEGVADPTGMCGVRLEVETHIITASTTAMKNLTKCVSEVGADIEGVVFSGIASAEAVLTDTEKELGVILVDIGGGTTSVVIFIEGAPAYSSVLPIGAKNVTNDLAIGLRLSLEGAEKLKLGFSKKLYDGDEKTLEEEKSLNKTTGNKEDEIDLSKLGIHEETKKVSQKTIVEGIIRPRLNEIFGMVAAEIQKSGYGGLTPSGIVLTGGGAMTVGVVEACKRSLSLPVRVGIPGGITGLIDDILEPSFSSAIGLLHYCSNETGGTVASTFSFSGLSDFTKKIPVKGMVGKIGNFIKSFLP